MLYMFSGKRKYGLVKRNAYFEYSFYLNSALKLLT